MRDWVSIQSYIHAREKEKPVPDLECMISQNGETSYLYALRVLNGPFPLGEDAIALRPEWAVRYARFIIKRRFPKAEEKISSCPELCYEYFAHVVKKKLPKKMHQAMLMLSFRHPQNYFIAKYLNEIGVL